MKTNVCIKRLSNCFSPSSRFEKLRATKAFLEMFPETKPKRKGLEQFDEKTLCPWHNVTEMVHAGTISDEQLDDFMEQAGIPLLASPPAGFLEIQVPERATSGAAGFDLQAAIDDSMAIMPGKSATVSTGLAVKLPDNIELQVRPRSGLAAKKCVTVLNSPGTVDSDYTGEIKAILINHSTDIFVINRGDRIAQAVFNEVVLPEFTEVDELEKTDRGSKGFGSTGR